LRRWCGGGRRTGKKTERRCRGRRIGERLLIHRQGVSVFISFFYILKKLKKRGKGGMETSGRNVERLEYRKEISGHSLRFRPSLLASFSWVPLFPTQANDECEGKKRNGNGNGNGNGHGNGSAKE
jgi:hypothetical protein